MEKTLFQTDGRNCTKQAAQYIGYTRITLALPHIQNLWKLFVLHYANYCKLFKYLKTGLNTE